MSNPLECRLLDVIDSGIRTNIARVETGKLALWMYSSNNGMNRSAPPQSWPNAIEQVKLWLSRLHLPTSGPEEKPALERMLAFLTDPKNIAEHKECLQAESLKLDDSISDLKKLQDLQQEITGQLMVMEEMKTKREIKIVYQLEAMGRFQLSQGTGVYLSKEIYQEKEAAVAAIPDFSRNCCHGHAVLLEDMDPGTITIVVRERELIS